jgi:hypothetical protein
MAIGIAGILALAMAAPAAADKVTFVSSTTTLKVTPVSATSANYEGRVTCKPEGKGKGKRERTRRRLAADRCEKNRVVEVWHGVPDNPGSFLIDSVATDDDGDWKAFGNLPPSGDLIVVRIGYTERKAATCRFKDQHFKAP